MNPNPVHVVGWRTSVGGGCAVVTEMSNFVESLGGG